MLGKAKEWKPTLKQEKVISIPYYVQNYSVNEIFFGGAAGGGKTDLGIVFPVVKTCKYSWFCLNCKKLNYQSNFCIHCEYTKGRPRLWYEHPKFKGIVLRRIIKELKKELVKRCYEYLPQTGAEYNKADRVWTWPEGGQLFLDAAEHEEDVRKYDTEQFCYTFFEELTSFTEFMYVFMFSRNRSADEDLPALTFSASNPGNIGHGWVRKRFVEPAKEGGKILRQYFYNKDGTLLNEDNKEHPNFGKPRFAQRIFIKALLTDNPYLLKNDPDYVTKLHLLPEAEKAAKLYGDWWTFSGQVFDSFRDKQYPDEPDNALHVISSEFTIPDWWPRILAIDWGFKAATVAYWGAISPKGRVYIYREYYVRETGIETWGTEIGDLSRGENLKGIVLDTNAWDSRGEEKTIAEQFLDYFNKAYGTIVDLQSDVRPRAFIMKANKGRVSGKILVQDYLRWKQKPIVEFDDKPVYDEEQAERLRRVSPSAYERYVELFKPPVLEDNLPRLQILDSCKRLIECIPLCVYDDKNVEDVKEWQATEDTVGDDPYDCLRYLLKRCHKYMEESKNESEERDREQEVVTYLQSTNDMTGFYRRMEMLERSKKLTRKASRNVPRFLRKARVH